VLDKARAARRAIDDRKLAVEIEIDGGIKIDNAKLAADAGIDILVSGTGIFGQPDPAAAIRDMRATAWRRSPEPTGREAERRSRPS
jgi:ribulose-phosphate 3-epimerase